MRNVLRDLIELASIELAYARAEIAIMERSGDEKTRIANHLDSASENLSALTQAIGEFEIVAGQKHARKLIAWVEKPAHQSGLRSYADRRFTAE
jgi:hypothetical protein